MAWTAPAGALERGTGARVRSVCQRSPNRARSLHTRQAHLPALRSLAPPLGAVGGVVGVVASLAERGQVQQARRLWPSVVDVGSGQHHAATSLRVWLAILRAAPLAAPARAAESDKSRSRPPVCGIAGAHFRTNRHYRTSPDFRSGRRWSNARCRSHCSVSGSSIGTVNASSQSAQSFSAGT